MRKDVKTTNNRDIQYQHSQNEFIGTLLYYMRDCPSIANNIQTTALSSGLGFRYSITPHLAVNMKFDYERALRFVGTYVEDRSYNNNVFFEASVFYRIK